MDRFQQIRIRVEEQVAGVEIKPVLYRINAQTDKNYKYLKGIYVSLPDEHMHNGTCLGLQVGQVELFEDKHETKLLSCGYNVSPNDMFFRIDGKVEAGGNEVKGLLTVSYPPYQACEAIIYLWLSNEE